MDARRCGAASGQLRQQRSVNGHRAVTEPRWLDEEGTADDPKCLIRWWAHQDSNLKPRDYESPALTVEL